MLLRRLSYCSLTFWSLSHSNFVLCFHIFLIHMLCTNIGTFSTNPDASCTSCPAGKYSAAIGASLPNTCTDCPAAHIQARWEPRLCPPVATAPLASTPQHTAPQPRARVCHAALARTKASPESRPALPARPARFKLAPAALVARRARRARTQEQPLRAIRVLQVCILHASSDVFFD